MRPTLWELGFKKPIDSTFDPINFLKALRVNPFLDRSATDAYLLTSPNMASEKGP
jgi:hypothetical protein